MDTKRNNFNLIHIIQIPGQVPLLTVMDGLGEVRFTIQDSTVSGYAIGTLYLKPMELF